MDSFLSHVRTYIRWYSIAFLVLVSGIVWYVYYRESRHGLLTVAFLSVGQGDAIYIESPTGTQVIVDGGPAQNLMGALSHVMPWYDRHVDMIVVTNPDLDHYSGFISFLNRYRVDSVLESGTKSKTETYALLEKEISNKKIQKIVGTRGQVIDIGGGAYLSVLFPDRDVSDVSSNDGSLVMRLVYGDTSVMLQGDSTARIEEYLISLDMKNATSTLTSTILKAGHHGSRTSTTESYVARVHPQWAVISSGTNNDYGHPHIETLKTLEKFSVPTLDTCVMGTVVFTSDGINLQLKNKKIIPVSAGCLRK